MKLGARENVCMRRKKRRLIYSSGNDYSKELKRLEIIKDSYYIYFFFNFVLYHTLFEILPCFGIVSIFGLMYRIFFRYRMLLQGSS